MQAIANWYQQLSAREQRIVSLALPLAFIIVALMLLQNLQRDLTAAKSNYDQALSDYQWLRTDTVSLQQWRKEFGNRNLGTMSSAAELGSLLNDGIKKFRLRGTVTPVGENWRVSLNASDGNRTLSFIEAAVGSGAIPEQVKITRADTRGNISGQLVFKALLP